MENGKQMKLHIHLLNLLLVQILSGTARCRKASFVVMNKPVNLFDFMNEAHVDPKRNNFTV